MRLYIIRHADPDYDNNTITPDGHREARALADRLTSHGLDRIYTSPMGRAKDTMQYTADLLQLQPSILDWTQELSSLRLPNGKWNSVMAWDVPAEIALRAKPAPDEIGWHTTPHYRDVNIQKICREITIHSDSFLASLGYQRQGKRYRCLRANEEKVAIFCHGGFGLTWLALLLHIPVATMWSGFWLPPSSVTTILFDQRSEHWATPRCIGLADVSHLYQANLPVKPRGIKANFY